MAAAHLHLRAVKLAGSGAEGASFGGDMKTDVVRVSSDGSGREEAYGQAEKFAGYEELGKKESLQIRLLTEETLGMVGAITGNFCADFWLESEEGGKCTLHLVAETDMNSKKKQELVDVSTRRRNEAATTFMGRIADMIEDGLNALENPAEYPQSFYDQPGMYVPMGQFDADAMTMSSLFYSWSLGRFRSEIGEAAEGGEDPEAAEIWDQLEKSIVASVSDDVKVYVRGRNVEMVIEKTF